MQLCPFSTNVGWSGEREKKLAPFYIPFENRKPKILHAGPLDPYAWTALMTHTSPVTALIHSVAPQKSSTRKLELVATTMLTVVDVGGSRA